MTTIGLIGAGHMGAQLAWLAVSNGYDLVISNSRAPESLADMVKKLGVRARAGLPAEAARAADIVIVGIPFKSYQSVPVEPCAGKIVIDTNNYYAQRDGNFPELDNETSTSSQLLQAHLQTSLLVKAFNHLYAGELTSHAQPRGSSNRRALALAGDDWDAKDIVSRMLDRFGFDAVDLGALRDSWRIEPGTPGYGRRRNAQQLREDLAAARRGAYD